MAIEVMNWVWDHSKSKHAARLVLLAIADHMSGPYAWAWPSNRTLAEKTNLTDRGVQLAVQDLVKLGELEVGRNEGPKGCNRYRVLATPEKFSPPKSFHPEQTAPPNDFRGQVFPLAVQHDPEQISPPENPSPPKNSASDPENFSPRTVRNHQNSSSKKSVRDEPQRDDVDQICNHLAAAIAANGSKRPTVTVTWRREARLLLDADGRTVAQVLAAIDWCQANSFWRSKVMSMPKLREKYDQLRLEAKAELDRRNRVTQPPAAPRPSTTDQRVADAQALKDRIRSRNQETA